MFGGDGALASSMITDVSFPTPCADSNSLTSAEAAVESIGLVRVQGTGDGAA